MEILENRARFPHCILLTRVGSFYESYFEQAAEVARLLNIKLTTRKWGGQTILMCGFPLMHLDKYLKVLVQKNHRFVAMCEEFPLPKPLNGRAFDRRVVRVVTPGTLIDEPFLNQYENSFLLAIGYPSPDGSSQNEDGERTSLGLAWMDVSTGEFYTKQSTLETVRDDLARIGPKEVVLDKLLEPQPDERLHRLIREEGYFLSFASVAARSADDTPLPPLESGMSDAVADDLDTPAPLVSGDAQETAAINLLTSFLSAHLMEHMPRLSSPSREVGEGRMQIDSHTIKALEIREGMREGGAVGSLLSVVKRTVTSSGTRLLARWLCSPSTSLHEINARQSLVAFFHSRPHLRADLVEALQRVEDTTRIVQKFLSGRGDFVDLVAVSATIGIWSSIKDRLELEKKMDAHEEVPGRSDDWTSLDILLSRFTELRDLASRIDRALRGREVEPMREDEGADAEEQDGESMLQAGADDGAMLNDDIVHGVGVKWTIRPEFSDELAKLHRKLQDLYAEREALQRRLQLQYDAPSLTLRASRSHGLHVHLAKGKRDKAKLQASPSFILISESGSTASYFLQEWSRIGTLIFDTTAAISNEERLAFDGLRGEVVAHTTSLRRNARIIDELDVTLGFANLAVDLNLVRPAFCDDPAYHVVNARHPTVEIGLLEAGRVFIPNTIDMRSGSRVQIITGPNMGGKSTLLRSVAIIAILAQTGSFVPADEATLGVVDRVLSRVGAKDDLFRDRSTFMVEMLETAEILRRATPRSLVIMDEVGRGTTTKDGLAIAFSTLHHLHDVNGCRALFATHFHELADMVGYSEDGEKQPTLPDVAFFCTDVDETEDGLISYSHRLRPGVNRDSHGLKVARLAGMPPSAMSIAEQALLQLRSTGDSALSTQHQLREIGRALALPP
ncbi:hypothetical protein PUNSTDRAFT_48476 [Punctularia strigosozonata HHB-11173 SS5]|uniref:uncharacterized protein n=1 Tax=Punctularia strigosozonata (strain HHB-11173) TaxID=741275 RepID=UPI0004416A46|nr:uncharacterized protein PUNSTDRAFT_48476 [Punctularia strigosozonata HHB-11173 SS5]EIN13528.1 hypothetical protein PUNSTDRAFT_48476 [Punctularia strigosozonata HHB-11173 SS5]